MLRSKQILQITIVNECFVIILVLIKTIETVAHMKSDSFNKKLIQYYKNLLKFVI